MKTMTGSSQASRRANSSCFLCNAIAHVYPAKALRRLVPVSAPSGSNDQAASGMTGTGTLLTNILFVITLDALIFCLLCLLMLADDLIMVSARRLAGLIW